MNREPVTPFSLWLAGKAAGGFRLPARGVPRTGATPTDTASFASGRGARSIGILGFFFAVDFGTKCREFEIGLIPSVISIAIERANWRPPRGKGLEPASNRGDDRNSESGSL
jgi:hypothetical protein